VRTLLAIQARWERLNTHRADLVMVTSQYCAGVAQRDYGVPSSRVAIVPEPIDLDGVGRSLRAAKAASRGPGDLVRRRMYPRKRLGDLRAAALLRGRIPEARVRIVGRGPEWDALVRLHGELGLGERVELLGDVTLGQLAEEYVSADVFCLPSVQEGFGIVFLEAMAARLPVVACRRSRAVSDGVTGLPVAPRDPALADALASLLGMPHAQRARRRRARAEAFTPRPWRTALEA
jgi:glycosyltransferase involved in cell wall biosynthesis